MSTAAVRQPQRDRTLPPVDSQQQNNELAPTIQSIIDRGRQSETVALSARGAWVLPAASTVMLWACFTPLNFSPVAWLAIVPLCLLVRATRRPRAMYRWLYLGGFAWSIITFQWMRLGHPSMYVGLTALSIYLAMYFPLFVGLTRVAVHRYRVPLVIAVPIVWTGLEYARAHLLTGVSWYYLGHSQYRWIELIQISDLVGAYGVSFVVAMANAGLAFVLPVAVLQKLQLTSDQPDSRETTSTKAATMSVALCVAILLSTVGYGVVRRNQAAFVEGPRVAIVQGNFTSEVKHDGNKAEDILRQHEALMFAALHHGLNTEAPPPRPELIVWPETMFPWPMCDIDEGMTDEEILRVQSPRSRLSQADFISLFRDRASVKHLQEAARSLNTAMLVGINSFHATRDREEHRNSVAFVTPQLGLEGTYDKMHLVMFGEYIPLKKYLPILARFTPYGSGFGLEAGNQASLFEYAGATFSPVICFEDTVPHLVTGIARSARKAKRPLDFWVNNTNDGWFHGSSELDQHLITASFRCVETRTPMVRSVNTGVSAFIDGDGVIREPDIFIDGDGKDRTFLDKSGRWNKQLNAALVDNVPLDNRTSLYVQTGDVFAGTCGFACVLLLASGFRRRRQPQGDTP